MIKDNQKTLNRLHIFMDAAIIVVSYLIAYYLRFYSFLTKMNIFSVESGTFYPLNIYAKAYIYCSIVSYYITAKLYTQRGKKMAGFFHSGPTFLV